MLDKGPFAAGNWADLPIFQRWLKAMLNHGECVEADGGYRGDANVKHPKDCTNFGEEEMKSAARARHETVNRRLKIFRVLKDTFRHDLNKHIFCFDACAVVTQLNLQSFEPIYQVDYQIIYS